MGVGEWEFGSWGMGDGSLGVKGDRMGVGGWGIGVGGWEFGSWGMGV